MYTDYLGDLRETDEWKDAWSSEDEAIILSRLEWNSPLDIISGVNLNPKLI